jgi:ABC-type antimicrobial peptide transport system permease subunit
MSFFIKRVAHYWQMLLTLALGVVLATGILACGPLLINTVGNFTLPYQLRNADPLASNLRLTTYDRLQDVDYQELDSQLHNLLKRRLGNQLAQINALASSSWVYPWTYSQLNADQRIAISTYQNMADKVTFSEGGWPSGAALQNNVLQVVISEGFAETYGLNIGDQLPVSKQLTETSPSLWFSIGGIIRPNNPGEAYWFGKYSPLQNQASDRWSAQFYVFVPADQFFSINASLFRTANTRLDWNVLINPLNFRVTDIPATINQIGLLRADLKEQSASFNLETKLDQILSGFNARSRVVQITLYILVIEVLFLAIYYVVMVASLSVQQVQGEFSTLSSRGASFKQLFEIQSTEALLISLLALTIGPALAIIMVWSLTKLGPLVDIAISGWQIAFPPASWMMVAIGILVCLAGMLLPVSGTIRRSVVTYSRMISRAERAPWWQRIYLDVFILIVALVLLWRLRFYGSLATSTGSGGSVDWLLILSPLVLLLSSATILLRIFPPILRLFSRAASFLRGITANLALWQSSRYPSHVVRLVLLLTLTMALGILTTGINATLDGSEYERALYATGSDLRLAYNNAPSTYDIDKIEGVNATSAVWRGSGSSTTRIHELIPSFDILAIDPISFSHVSRYRDDYADQPMGELLGKLIAEQGADDIALIPLPGMPSRLGMWIYDLTWTNPDQAFDVNPLDYLTIYAKLQTADNRVITARLLPAAQDEPAQENNPWTYYEAALPELSQDSYPLSFHSFWFTMSRSDPMFPRTGYYRRVDLLLDDFLVIDRVSSNVNIFEGFEDIERIWQTNNQQSPVNYTKTLPNHTGEASLQFSFPYQINPTSIALLPVSTIRQASLPALMSQEFIKNSEAKVGDTLLLNIQGMQMQVDIVGSVIYFPTMYDTTGRGFLIVPWDILAYRLNRLTRLPVNYNEIWIATENEQVSSKLLLDLPYANQSWDLAAERLTLRADPLMLGIRSVTYLAYILTAILSLVGFATHFYMSARQREMQFGILRSLGLSPGQLYGWLSLEQIIMILAGLSLGTLLGILLNKLILPGLPISFGNKPAIPPFITLENWVEVFKLYLTLLVSFILTLGVATVILWRSNIHRALRVGQE